MNMDQKPRIGLGLWKITNDVCADVVYNAIKLGYRHLDSACDYGNEIEVGKGIARALKDRICERADLWITSKLWNTYHRAEHVPLAFEKTLADLDLDYLDSYLIHFPIAQPFVPFDTRYPPEWLFDPDAVHPKMRVDRVPLSETWGAMESLVDSGRVRHIGVCNYNTGLLHDLMAYARIAPSELQIEAHPYLTQERLMRVAAGYNLAVTAFSPLGASSYVELDMADSTEAVIDLPIVREIAAVHGKTAAQVVLRWGVQRGCYLVTKSTHTERLIENLNVFDFELTDEQMAAISGLNQNRRFNDPGTFCEAAFHTFYPIYD
jgi:D-xylose reductase